MITHVEKDKVLHWLCTNKEHTQKNCHEQTELDLRMVNEILDYFAQKGLILKVEFNYRMAVYDLRVTIDGFDLYNHGGYTAQELLFAKNLEKLDLELRKLESDFPERVQSITGIITAVTAVASLIFPASH